MSNIRFATIDDINNIMKFIDDHWKKNHILARNKDFFIYEHKDIYSDVVNYVISLENNIINGVLGFIKYSESNSDIATVIWKALKSNSSPMLGIELLEFLRINKRYNILFSSGINKETVGIYKYLEFYTGKLSQYIIINNYIKSFKILKIGRTIILNKINFIQSDAFQLIELNEIPLDFDFYENKSIPQKDRDYFIKRFVNHPVYKYKIYGIYVEEVLKSLIVTRVLTVDSSSVLRVMDYIGDESHIVFISNYLYQIVIDNNYEYIDFMCFGFNSLHLKGQVIVVNSNR